MITYSELNPIFLSAGFLMVGGIFSFITAPFATVGSAIGKVVSAGKAKKTAEIYARDATKQRAHELKMANLAAGQQAGKAKQTQMILLVGGGIAVIGFLFLRKRR